MQERIARKQAYPVDAGAGTSARENEQTGRDKDVRTEPGHKTEPPGTAEQWARLQRNAGRVSAPAGQGTLKKGVLGMMGVRHHAWRRSSDVKRTFAIRKKMKDGKELRQDR